jgi:hypothetical protein
MPLSPPELAEFALRTAGANYFDPRGIPRLSERGRDEIDGRLNSIQEAVTRASSEVTDHSSLATFLSREAARLETTLPERQETPETCAAVEKVIQALRDLANHTQASHDGDGPANGTCSCGVLPLASAVEQHVACAYAEALMQTIESGLLVPPGIIYKTYITPDIPHKLGQFNVGGQTRIDTGPSQVTIFIKKKARILARDLWQLAYVFHHELVCHGFQCATKLMPSERKNAPVGCHWTEGWMDAVAFMLAKHWASCEDCKSCFTFGGAAAIGEMNEMHQARYPNPNATDPTKKRPPDISEDDAYLRLYARQAFDALTAAMALVGDDPRDAEDMAAKFSLRLNAHENVNLDTLRRVSTRLQSTLLNGIRLKAARAAASACLDFAATGNLVNLENALALAATEGP